jgi:hypothetical protein
MKHPYYIVAPRYIRTSAGVRVLYKLCDLINKSGASAFIYLRPHSNIDLSCSPMDVAPFLTDKIATYHFENGLTPVVIYPETFDISKFNAPFRVRYLLNYDKLLFSNKALDNDDYLIAYSENIADQLTVKKPISTIFLPVSDPIFYCPPKIENRHGGVFYAGKYKYHFGGKTFSITDGLPEITRDEPRSQSPEEIRKLFQESEFFYCYEDSALALEAMLCGCPTVFIPNKFFTETLANQELLGLGYAWGTSEQEIQRAKNTVHLVRNRYIELVNNAQYEIKKFVDKTQLIAQRTSYKKMFAANLLPEPSNIDLSMSYYWMIRDSISDKGLLTTLKIIAKRIRAFRLKIFNH